jgi:hypothetical protein
VPAALNFSRRRPVSYSGKSGRKAFAVSLFPAHIVQIGTAVSSGITMFSSISAYGNRYAAIFSL